MKKQLTLALLLLGSSIYSHAIELPKIINLAPKTKISQINLALLALNAFLLYSYFSLPTETSDITGSPFEERFDRVCTTNAQGNEHCWTANEFNNTCLDTDTANKMCVHFKD